MCFQALQSTRKRVLVELDIAKWSVTFQSVTLKMGAEAAEMRSASLSTLTVL